VSHERLVDDGAREDEEVPASAVLHGRPVVLLERTDVWRSWTRTGWIGFSVPPRPSSIIDANEASVITEGAASESSGQVKSIAT
jgi:hypothetical protein